MLGICCYTLLIRSTRNLVQRLLRIHLFFLLKQDEMMQNCFERFEAKLSGNMFVEDGRFLRDLAMEKVDSLGPKLTAINPPMHVPILSSDWNPSVISIEKIDVSQWEGSNKFCVVLHDVLSTEECQHLIDLSERRGYDKAPHVRAHGERKFLNVDARNNDRCVYDDSQLTEQVWQRVLKATAQRDKTIHNALTHVPWVNERHQKRNTGKTFSAVGLNERMRFLRSDPGTVDTPHCDSSHVRYMEAGVDRFGERSFLSFQLYLNDDFDGGATRFLPEERESGENENENEDHNECLPNLGQVNPSKRARTKPSKHDVTPRTGSVLLFQHDCCHEETSVRAGRKYTLRSYVMYTSLGPGMEYSKRPIMARQLDDLY